MARLDSTDAVLRDGAALQAELLGAWEAMCGEPPGSLADDLRRLGELFGPGVSRERIGQVVRGLPPSPLGPTTSRLYPSLLLPAGLGVLVTLEGRVALELLRQDNELSAQEAAARAGTHPTVIETYRQWANDRIEQAIATEEGRGEKMYPVAIGATLVLMLRQADSEARALQLPRAGSRLDEALMRPLSALNAKVAKGAKADLKTPFRAYPIKKAERRLGARLVVSRPSRGAWRAWVPAGDWPEVLTILADELVGRRDLPEATALGAVEAFAAVYDAVAPELAELGLPPAEDDSTWVLRDLRQRIQRLASH
jgi:hypothetical protein